MRAASFEEIPREAETFEDPASEMDAAWKELIEEVATSEARERPRRTAPPSTRDLPTRAARYALD